MEPKSVTKRMNDLSINKYELDEEWVEQGQRRYRYHEKIASAIRIRDKVSVDQNDAKNEYKRVHARLMVQIKQDPSKFNIKGKASDVVCDSIALDHPDRVKAFSHYIETSRRLAKMNYEVHRLNGMLDSFIDRRKALESLISLYLNNYFGQNPRIQEMADDVFSNRKNDEFTRKLSEDEDLVDRLISKRKRQGGEDD